MTTLLGTHNAVILRLTHATITTKESRDGREVRKVKTRGVKVGAGERTDGIQRKRVRKKEKDKQQN